MANVDNITDPDFESWSCSLHSEIFQGICKASDKRQENSGVFLSSDGQLTRVAENPKAVSPRANTFVTESTPLKKQVTIVLTSIQGGACGISVAPVVHTAR